MKKLLIALFILVLPFTVFAQQDLQAALSESNELLGQAYSRIEELEAQLSEAHDALDDSNKTLTEAQVEIERLRNRVEVLEADIEDYKTLLREANVALAESNRALERAYDRIESDQTEISGLRDHIQKLIDGGVEIRIPTWNVQASVGYPTSANVQLSLNFPFFPKLGLTVGAFYSFEHQLPFITAGLKLNLDID